MHTRHAHRSPAATLACIALGATAVLAVWPTPAEAGAGAPAPVPCQPAGNGRHNCNFYIPGNGISGGAPVQDNSGKTVGFLHQGVNWVLCQRPGQRVTYRSWTNTMWAYTMADNDAYGWVNAVYARGGDDDGGFAGVPACGTTHGQPPRPKAAAPPVTSPPAPPKTPSPTPSTPAPAPPGTSTSTPTPAPNRAPAPPQSSKDLESGDPDHLHPDPSPGPAPTAARTGEPPKRGFGPYGVRRDRQGIWSRYTLSQEGTALAASQLNSTSGKAFTDVAYELCQEAEKLILELLATRVPVTKLPVKKLAVKLPGWAAAAVAGGVTDRLAEYDCRLLTRDIRQAVLDAHHNDACVSIVFKPHVMRPFHPHAGQVTGDDCHRR